MIERGPKPNTADNSPDRAPNLIRDRELLPTSQLEPEALREFWRLCDVLDQRGYLERVDLALITNAAWYKAEIDRLRGNYAKKRLRATLADINAVSERLRSALRDLGLPLQPSRVVLRTQPKSVSDDPVASRIRIA